MIAPRCHPPQHPPHVVLHPPEPRAYPPHVGGAPRDHRAELGPDAADLVVAGLGLHLQLQGQGRHALLEPLLPTLFVVVIVAAVVVVTIVTIATTVEGEVDVPRDGEVGIRGGKEGGQPVLELGVGRRIGDGGGGCAAEEGGAAIAACAGGGGGGRPSREEGGGAHDGQSKNNNRSTTILDFLWGKTLPIGRVLSNFVVGACRNSNLGVFGIFLAKKSFKSRDRTYSLRMRHDTMHGRNNMGRTSL